MTIELGLLLEGVSATKSVLEYLGVIEALERKIELKLDRLLSSDFEAGLRFLEQAKLSSGEQGSLLREARSSFTKALSLEHGAKLALAYLGLAVCHQHLGDHKNAERAIAELSKLSFVISTRDWVKAFAQDTGGRLGHLYLDEIKDRFSSVKNYFSISRSWKWMKEYNKVATESLTSFRKRQPVGQATAVLASEEATVSILRQAAAAYLTKRISA